MAGNWLMAWAAVVPFRSMTRAVHPHASTTSEAIFEPGRPMFSARSGQAATVRSARTRARLLRCAHQGMPSITVEIPAMAGSGFTAGPTAMAADSQPR